MRVGLVERGLDPPSFASSLLLNLLLLAIVGARPVVQVNHPNKADCMKCERSLKEMEQLFFYFPFRSPLLCLSYSLSSFHLKKIAKLPDLYFC